ncbi:MAG: TadE/TadG family type IV pilus assembly protein [Pseudomonadota bacterium]
MRIVQKLKKAAGFKTNEDGNASIEFAILLPLFVIVFVSTFEVGMAMTRLTVLEHGLDVTVRAMRLGTGAEYEHDDIRDMVCDNASMLDECYETLQVELVRIDPDTWVMPAEDATCVRRASTAEPLITFRDNGGAPNDIMFMRVCYVVDPMYPAIGLGSLLTVDASGAMQLIAETAFAQEPS